LRRARLIAILRTDRISHAGSAVSVRPSGRDLYEGAAGPAASRILSPVAGAAGFVLRLSREFRRRDRLDAKRAAAAWADGGGNPPRPSRCGSTPASGIERNQNSEAVEAVGASGNGAFARRASCRTCTSCGPAPQGCSHNGVLKHRQASGVASARNGESGAGYAEAPTFRPGQLRPDDRYSSSTTGLRNIPSSGEEISTTSPALSQRGGSARGPSLTGVPVTMTSAGLIVMKVVM
jgi:hypothetical protein